MLNIIPIVTIKKITIQRTQKEMKRESNISLQKKKKSTNVKDSKKRNGGGQRTNSTTAEVSPFLPVITLNVNGLNSPKNRIWQNR